MAVDPHAPDWRVLEQALEVAAGEGARVHGLCILPAQGREEGIEAIAAEFEARCRARKVPGNLVVAEGEPLAAIQDRVRWVDLLVLGLDPVPGSQPATWSGLAPELVLEHSVCPILVVNGRVSALERLLLVTDGSKQARSALFLATYLALHRSASLAVLAAEGHGQSAAEVCATTQVYLGYCSLQARFSTQSGPAREAVRAAAEQNGCDLVILAGSGDAQIAAGLGIPVLMSFR